MPNELTQTQKVQKIKQDLSKNMKSILAGLPAHIKDPTRFARIAMSTIEKNPALTKCTVPSLLAAIIESAQLGLSVDGFAGEAYIVPYKTHAQLIPGYKGLTKLARQSGEVANIMHDVVREGDQWEYQKMPAHLVHNPLWEFESDKDADRYYSDATIRGAYARFELTNGTIVQDYWPIQKLRAHGRKFSPAYRANKSDCCWIANLDIACRKTVLRSLVARGLVPVSTELIKMLVAEEVYESTQTVDAAFVSVQSKGNLDDLTANLTEELEEMDKPEADTTKKDVATEEVGEEEQAEETTTEQPDWRFLDLPGPLVKALEACKTAKEIGSTHGRWKEKVTPEILDVAIAQRVEEISR